MKATPSRYAWPLRYDTSAGPPSPPSSTGMTITAGLVTETTVSRAELKANDGSLFRSWQSIARSRGLEPVDDAIGFSHSVAEDTKAGRLALFGDVAAARSPAGIPMSTRHDSTTATLTDDAGNVVSNSLTPISTCGRCEPVRTCRPSNDRCVDFFRQRIAPIRVRLLPDTIEPKLAGRGCQASLARSRTQN